MPANRTITRADLMPTAAYAKIRKERRQALLEKKKFRRLEVGPVASFLFESYDSMWLQVQEMLYIERGGDAQIDDELAAYNPLIPQGDELVATVLFEIDEPQRRKSFLGRLGGVEETAFLSFAGETVDGRPETDVDRTTADGKASAVQFLHFRFTPAQIAKFRTPGTQIVLGFRHPAYAHMAVMPEAVREALAGDFA
jgi:Protein of unknown function (DUF3501)